MTVEGGVPLTSSVGSVWGQVRRSSARAFAALRRWNRKLTQLELREPWLVWATGGLLFVALGFALHRPATGIVGAVGWIIGRRVTQSRHRRRLLPPPPSGTGPHEGGSW